MYINFDAISQRMDMTHFFVLQSIKQKDKYHEAYPDVLVNLENEAYIQKLKNGGYKLTGKGTSFLFMVTEIQADSDAYNLAEKLVDIYEESGRKFGKRAEIASRLAWFISATMFNDQVIIDTVENYVKERGEYSLTLENLIWKPSSVFSVHKNLRESTLFDIIYNKYKVIDPKFFFDDKYRDKEMQWMLAIGKLPSIPRSISKDATFTGSAKGDEEAILRIKGKLFDRIRMRDMK